ncbi:putative serine/threonine-protein kinase [Nymphaea thermarum]|nr:putative serine/threonine-protein kinase [Nymphaea thermarum]
MDCRGSSLRRRGCGVLLRWLASFFRDYDNMNGSPTGDRCSGESELPDLEIAETDPSGRYIRYTEVLGKGAFKTVYRSFDEVDGIEVAWNQVKMGDVLRSPEDLERLYSEVHLLKSLKHDNIIKFFSSWVDEQKKTINIITELFTSGSLRKYRLKHKKVDMKAVKNWARQILRGLQYLHGHNPPIIHRDLKCDNIFVNGNHGQVKIGDLGLATIMQQPSARSVIGTPEFMAPELYEEEYNELVDIYSFGMCLLEMVTFEYPYSECKNPAQIYKKVSSGIKPAALDMVNDPEVKLLIEKCLAPVAERPSARELLKYQFLQHIDLKEQACNPLQLPTLVPQTSYLEGSSVHSDAASVTQVKSGPLSMDIDYDYKQLSMSTNSRNSINTHCFPSLEYERSKKNYSFRLKGDKTDANSISLVLRIAGPDGRVKNVHFMFYLDSDTALSVASEMVDQLDLSDQDVTFIAEFIDFLIMKLIPEWKPSVPPSENGTNCVRTESKVPEHARFSIGYSWDGVHGSSAVKGIQDVLSGSDLENYCIDLSSVEGSIKQQHEDGAFTKPDDAMSHGGFDSPSSSAAAADQESLESVASGVSTECSNVVDLVPETRENNVADVANLDLSVCNLNDFADIANTRSYASSSLEEDEDEELKAEFDLISQQYQQWFQELSRQRDEALEEARKRWATKNKQPAA